MASRFPIELIHNGMWRRRGLRIVGLAYGGGLPARVLAWRPLRQLGERSLAIYLLHLPILAWMQALGVLPRDSRMKGVVGFLAFVAITLAVSVLVSDYFVAPASRWLRLRFGGATQGSGASLRLTAPTVDAPPVVATI